LNLIQKGEGEGEGEEEEEEGDGEMVRRLRALTALPQVLNSNPSNYLVAHNHL
jgi:hypothetical protein